MKTMQIREMVREELKCQVMSESDQHIEERASTGVVKRILASIGGWYLGTTIGSIPFALGLISTGGVLTGGAGLVTMLAGGYWFAKEGHKLAVRAGPDVTIETYQELRRITVERDKVLQKIHKIVTSHGMASAKHHKHAAKLDSLTSWMEKLGKELERVANRERNAAKIDKDQFTAMISVAKAAQQGTLTYIEDAKTVMSYVER